MLKISFMHMGCEKNFFEKTITVDSCIEEHCDSLTDIETVFLCGVHSHE